ncbi:MAG: hypothetical protein KDF59_01190 [Nitrosomonas sp.]|nr:hypothetical protein [Nitrosomonas sp.]
MQSAEPIKRKRSDPDALDFATLRKDAINLVQQLCGENWTDYNLHDPGVTILEQLCFALTDLSYRSGFPVEDYLTNEKTTIDYEKLGLHQPYEILPSSAVTEADYEKILYDAIPEIDQVRFVTVQSGDHETYGLYTVFVKADMELFRIHAETDTVKDPCIPSETVETLSAKLQELTGTIDYSHSLLDRIAVNLQIRRNTLKRWLNRALRSGQINRGEEVELGKPDQRIGMIRPVLESADNCLEHLENQIAELLRLQTIINDIFPQFPTAWNNAAAANEQLVQWLENSALLFADLHTINELERISAALDQPLQKLDDLVPLLDDLLPQLVALVGQVSQWTKISSDGLVPLQHHAESWCETRLKNEVLRVFSRHRGLCEDIHHIHLVETKPYFLVGEVEVDSFHNPAKVYAEIFFKCARHISSNITIDHYASVLATGAPYEEVFSGPLMQHAYIQDGAVEMPRNSVTIMELMSLIREIDGVRQILNLELADSDGKRYESLDYQLSNYQQHCFPELNISQVDYRMPALSLSLPLPEDNALPSGSDAMPAIGNPTHEAFLDDFRHELKKLTFEYHAFRMNTQSFDQLIRPPQGQQRRLNAYYSIQNYFPAIYGINKYGIPNFKPVDVHAKAKQLKAYLYPFEQLMANYLQNLQSIPDLLSIGSTTEMTHRTQVLDHSNIPKIESLYTESDIDLKQSIDDVPGQYENRREQRKRWLDLQLALYGQRFDEKNLLRFNDYRSTDAESWITELKISYLKKIREISRDRGKGFDYMQPLNKPDQSDAKKHLKPISSALHARIGLLLGLQTTVSDSRITDVLVGKKSRVIPDRELARNIKFVQSDTPNTSIPVIHGFSAGQTDKKKLPARLPVFCDSLFKAGIRLDRYRLVQSEQEETLICFKPEQDSRLWILSKETTPYKAAVYAHQYCRILNQLNQACENFYIVEHILLRKRIPQNHDLKPVDDDFYRYRVSFVFPSWTARFSNLTFRRYAEETIQRNLPAHLFADILWLDFMQLQDFEQRHEAWLEQFQHFNHVCDEALLPQLDQVADQLRLFLIENRPEETCDYWL